MDYIDDAPCMVEGLESIANAQNVVKKLYDRGYSENEVKAICFDNAYHYILPYLKYWNENLPFSYKKDCHVFIIWTYK